MKNKAFYKAVGFWFIASLLVLGCKTKQVAVQTEEENHIADVSNMVEKQEKTEVSTQFENNSTEVKELTELLQHLNVSYSGQDVNDKLDLSFSKTEQGTKLTIAGKGTANYTDRKTTNIESLKLELYNRQDSLHNVELSYLQDLNAKINSYARTKDKDVQTKGFQFGFWTVLAIAVFSWIVLNLFLKAFKK